MASAQELRRLREQNSIFDNLYDTVGRQRAQLAAEGRRPVLGGLLSKEPVAGADTLRFEGFGPAIAGLLEPVARAIDAPAAAARGEIPRDDMLSEALNVAGMAALGGGAAPLPKGAVGANALFSRKPNNIMDEFRPETYYHGTRSDIDAFDPSMVDLGVHVGTKGQANSRLEDLIKKEDPVYTSPFSSFSNIEGQRPESAFRTGVGPSEGAQILPLKVRADYPLRMPDVGEWDRSEVVMYYIEKMLGEDGDQRLKDAFADFDFDALDDVRDQFYDKDEWKESIENREFLDEIRDRIKDAGYDSIVYKNAVEGSRDEGMQDSMIILDPSNLRSVNAEFDPAYSNYPDLLAANASKSAGLLNMAAAGAKKEDLDPLGYQKTKMRDYLSNTQLDKQDLGERLERTPIGWEQMENKLILPFYGDRTSGGYLLSGVDDIKFDVPVYTEGGVDFKRGKANQADRAIWASNSNIITRIANEADKARKQFEGEDIYGVTGSMAPDANDFAVHTGSAMAELVRGSKITRKGATEFNEMMRAIDPTFVGIRSPKLREWIDSTTSPNRKSFIRLMDSAPMQENGFPSPAQARLSVTDPTQVDMPSGMFGLGVSRLDELNPILRATPEGNRMQSVPHSTYNTQITGDYVGSLPPVPQGLLFKDVYDAMEGKTTKKGAPLNEAHKTHAIKTKMPVQRITPEILDGILNYFANLEK